MPLDGGAAGLMPPKRPTSSAPSPTRAAIAAACTERGISGRELARRTGTTPMQVTEFLAGRRDPALSTVERWLAALMLAVGPSTNPPNPGQ